MEKVICSKCGDDNISGTKYCSSCGFELANIQVENPLNIDQQKAFSHPNNKKKFVGIFVGVITFFIAYFGMQQLFLKTGILDKEMMNVASEINKTCPVIVDSETRLDNAVALPKNVFQYNYTLVNLEKNSADTITMKNYLEPKIVNLVKSSPQMQYQRDHKWTLNYCYKDKNGLYLLMVVVTPAKYGK